MRKAELISNDVRDWWDDNKSEIIPEVLEQCSFMARSETKDVAELMISEECEYGGLIDIDSLENFIEQYTELIIEGILNVVKTSEV